MTTERREPGDLSFPPEAGKCIVKHRIPAFAGRLRASSAARSRRGSAIRGHAGAPSRRIPDFLCIQDGPLSICNGQTEHA